MGDTFVLHKGGLPDLKEAVKDMAALALSTSSWKPLKQKQGVSTYYQKLDNSEYLMFMGETELNVPFDTLLTRVADYSINEVLDAMWIGAELIERKGPGDRICQYKFKFPPLIRNRDFLLHLYDGVLGTNPRVGAVAGISIEHDGCPPSPDFVRAVTLASGWIFREVTPHRSHVNYIVQVDLKGWLPVAVVNFVSKTQPMNVLRLKKYFEKLEKVEKPLSSSSSSNLSTDGVEDDDVEDDNNKKNDNNTSDDNNSKKNEEDKEKFWFQNIQNRKKKEITVVLV